MCTPKTVRSNVSLLYALTRFGAAIYNVFLYVVDFHGNFFKCCPGILTIIFSFYKFRLGKQRQCLFLLRKTKHVCFAFTSFYYCIICGECRLSVILGCSCAIVYPYVPHSSLTALLCFLIMYFYWKWFYASFHSIYFLNNLRGLLPFVTNIGSAMPKVFKYKSINSSRQFMWIIDYRSINYK